MLGIPRGFTVCCHGKVLHAIPIHITQNSHRVPKASPRGYTHKRRFDHRLEGEVGLMQGAIFSPHDEH
jgi:hypothetical protein